MTISAATLIARARQRADFVSSTFLDDASELVAWCVESYKELWDLLTEAYGEDYLVVDDTLNVSTLRTSLTGASGIDPPLQKLLRIERISGTQGIPLRRFNFSQNGALEYSAKDGWNDGTDVRYAIVNQTLFVQPIPQATEIVVLWYVPIPTLTLSADINVACEPWAEYIVTDLAIKMREKGNEPTEGFERAKENLRRRIVSVATPRDEHEAQRSIDVRGDDVGDLEGDWWVGWP